MQHIATHFRHATHRNTLDYTATLNTPCTLQHTATHSNMMAHTSEEALNARSNRSTVFGLLVFGQVKRGRQRARPEDEVVWQQRGRHYIDPDASNQPA